MESEQKLTELIQQRQRKEDIKTRKENRDNGVYFRIKENKKAKKE